MHFIRFIFGLLFLLSASIGSQSLAQERIALLVGNAIYSPKVGRLLNPINDVELVATALAKTGFKRGNINIVKNADRITLLDAVDTYVDRLNRAGKDAVGFFYYSGHGVANKRDRRNYLIPIGVGQLDRRVWFKAVALDDVVSKLSQLAPNAAHFVVFDACRNLLNAPTRGGKGFVPIATRRGMLIAFSTDPGETASDEGASSGPYAAALAAELIKPGQDHLDVFQNVKESVYRTTRAQVPWTRDGMLQRIYLGGRIVEKPAPTLAQKAELTFWNSVKDSDSSLALETYLKIYPKGKFSSLARTQADRLKKRAEKEYSARVRERELQQAEEKQRRAEQERKNAKLKATQARYSEEIRRARDEAKRATIALHKAEQERKAAIEAVNKANAERADARRQAEKAKSKSLAALNPRSITIPSNTETVLDGEELVRQLQTELVRVGCEPGPIDGLWGTRARRALRVFQKNLNINADVGKPTQANLDLVRSKTSRVCRKSVPKLAKSKASTTVKSTRAKKPKSSRKTASSGRCVTFNACMERCLRVLGPGNNCLPSCQKREKRC